MLRGKPLINILPADSHRTRLSADEVMKGVAVVELEDSTDGPELYTDTEQLEALTRRNVEI